MAVGSEILLDRLDAKQRQYGVEDYENGNLRQLYERLPVEFSTKYRESLNSAVSQPSAPAFMKACEGLAFEISRLLDLRQAIDWAARTGQPVSYEIRPEGKKIANPQKLKYRAYAPLGEAAKEKEIKLENDVALFREGQPIIYDTKSYPARLYGESTQNRDQVLKYQAAIDQGLIDTAVLEIRGRVQPDFLKWVMGSGLENPSPAPDVQIIYSVPLPSGAEFRFDLKRCKEPAKALPYFNDDSHYTDEDRAVAAGFLRALRDPNKSVIIGLVSGAHISDPSPELAPYLTPGSGVVPSDIKDITLHREYRDARLQGLWTQASAARQPTYNTENKLAATDEVFSDPEKARAVVRDVVETYQQGLRSNLIMAKVKASYILGDPVKNPAQYEKNVESVVDFITKNMIAVREQELQRKSSPHYNKSVADRKRMGWDSQPEGLALDVEHIMLDAILEVHKRDGQKGRSYENPAERFLTFAQMMAELKPERDELQRTLAVADPLASGQQISVQKDMTDQKISQSNLKLMLENIARAHAVLTVVGGGEVPAAFSKEKEKLQAIVDQLSPEKKRAIKKGADAQRNCRLEIENLRPSMEAAGKALGEAYKGKADPVAISQLQAARAEQETRYMDAVRTLHNRYETQVFTSELWQKFAKRSSLEETNAVKYIYAIVPVAQADGSTRDEFRIANERVDSLRSGRAAHSELAGGLNAYGAGEIVFEKIPTEGWILREINNGSGHYRPEVKAIDYVSMLFKRRLMDYLGRESGNVVNRAAQFMTHCRIIDSLAPGMATSSPVFDASLEGGAAHVPMNGDVPSLLLAAGRGRLSMKRHADYRPAVS